MSSVRIDRLDYMRRRLEDLHGRHLRRRLRTVSGGAEPWVDVNGRKLLNLSSNSYLGLASHPAVLAAAAAASNGGTGSSRLIAGTTPMHEQLEEGLATFKQTESALLFNSGYTANVGTIPALVGPGDLILSDRLNHASLIDGCRLSRADCRIYEHCDTAMLEFYLANVERSHHEQRRLVVTDTVFSMDGDLAPLAEIAALCDRYDALLLVDEAHATGCIGPGGRGLVAQLGLDSEAIIVMGTLSKAFGCFGAFVAARSLVTDFLLNLSRSFIFSTALPVPVVAASMAALDVLESNPDLPHRLQRNADFFRRGLQSLGFDTLTSETQIIPIFVGDAAQTMVMAEALRHEGVFAVAVRPPTVPLGTARIRASVMAPHTQSDLSFALDAFERVGRSMGLI